MLLVFGALFCSFRFALLRAISFSFIFVFVLWFCFGFSHFTFSLCASAWFCLDLVEHLLCRSFLPLFLWAFCIWRLVSISLISFRLEPLSLFVVFRLQLSSSGLVLVGGVLVRFSFAVRCCVLWAYLFIDSLRCITALSFYFFILFPPMPFIPSSSGSIFVAYADSFTALLR